MPLMKAAGLSHDGERRLLDQMDCMTGKAHTLVEGVNGNARAFIESFNDKAGGMLTAVSSIGTQAIALGNKASYVLGLTQAVGHGLSFISKHFQNKTANRLALQETAKQQRRFETTARQIDRGLGIADRGLGIIDNARHDVRTIGIRGLDLAEHCVHTTRKILVYAAGCGAFAAAAYASQTNSYAAWAASAGLLYLGYRATHWIKREEEMEMECSNRLSEHIQTKIRESDEYNQYKMQQIFNRIQKQN